MTSIAASSFDLCATDNGLWKKLFERQFGSKNLDLVVQRMEKAEVEFSWRQLYEAKMKEQEDKEHRISARMREIYKNEEAKKRNRQVKILDQTPPPSDKIPSHNRKRSSDSSTKKNIIMKKAKVALANSIEARNLAAMKIKITVEQRPNGVSSKRSC